MSPSVCQSRFLIVSSSLDGDMRTLPFLTHSIVGSTVGSDYARIQMLSVMGRGISLRRAILVIYR